jgi:hypothetical protein
LDASYFRNRAAIARELAQTGDDVRLAQMLMELAVDLEAEAEAIEAEQASAALSRPQQTSTPMPRPADRWPAQVIDLAHTGIKPRPEPRSGKGAAVVLPFPGSGTRRDATSQPVATCDAVLA